ncbi:kelch-like protein 1 isoform X3 [Eurosta solidaginis]|uniref:kelch-like protein 1 isoform X3 n=1 Tax=Eurosta solidaginis TaxID=178769 RepID=UPI0035311417
MAMALACGTRQRLSEVNPDGALYFIEKLLFQIYEHFDEQVLVDVTFKFSNPPALITAHRLILSAASPYFRQLFKSEEGICPLIEISDIDSDIFERLITFCYTGKTLITIENVDRMLKAALILQLDEAVANCIDFLMEYITDYTLARAYTFENEVQCALLSAKIYEYEIRNFASVIQSTEFLNFDVTKLQKILESDDLNITTEKEAFKAVKRWYEYDESARKQKVFDLISCLRLSQFHTNFIMENINPLPGCHVLAMEAISWVNVPSTRENVSLRFTSPRPRIAEAFMAFNFWDEDSRTIFQYNTTEDLWQKWVDIKPGVPDVQAIFMDDNLFLIGGIRNNTAINEVNSWNFRTKLFQRLPPMNQPRYLHCVVELNHKVYVVGGKGEDDEILNSVEIVLFITSDSQINKLQKMQNRAMRHILNARYDTSISSMLNTLKWLNVKQLISFHTMKYIYNIKTGALPDYLRENLSYSSGTHTYPTRDRHNFILPRCHTENAKLDLYYKSLKMFNELPVDIKTCNNLKKFKNLLYNYCKTYI